MEGKEYQGFAREFFDMFGRKKGFTFTYQPLPVKRLYKSLLTNTIDFKFPDSPFWQKEIKEGKNIIYSKPVVGFIDGVMVLPANKGKGADKLNKLGTILGFTAWDYMDRIKAGTIKISENNSFT